jgi:hypothetical protein
VHELDRILDRDDVIGTRAVDVVDHRAERRRLAGARGAGDEHEPLVERAQVEDVLREIELFRGEDLRRDDAEHGARPAAVGEHVGAEPREVLDLVREVGVVPLGELLPVLLRHDGREELDDLVAGQRPCGGIERRHVAVLAHDRGRADAEVQIGRAGFHHRLEQLIDRVRTHARGSSVTATMWAAFTRRVPSSVSM